MRRRRRWKEGSEEKEEGGRKGVRRRRRWKEGRERVIIVVPFPGSDE